MKLLILAVSIFYSVFAYSSMPLRIPLDKLVENTDHVLTGYVTGVDMIDGNGNQITDLSARTGPGIKNKIRLIVQVHKTHITNENVVPNEIAVPLDSAMHYSFGQIKNAHSFDGRKFLVLLKGKDFQPAFSGVFMRSLKEKDKVIKMFKNKKSKGQIDIKLSHKPLTARENYQCPKNVSIETCNLLIEFQMRY